MRQLLSHTSGLAQSYVSEGRSNRETAVHLMLEEPLVAAPGVQFVYSNSNYQLAAAIVEAVTGRSYDEYVRQELWERAGLAATGFAGDSAAKGIAATRETLPARLTRRAWGGEGVYSSTNDLYLWYRALHDGQILAAAGVTEMFKPVAPIQEGATALGWFVGKTARGSTCIFTRGNEDFGANALLYAYPESGVIIIVLTHAGDSPDGPSWSRFVLSRLETILGL